MVQWYFDFILKSPSNQLNWFDMTIQNLVFCRALIFSLRLRFPSGSLLTMGSARLLIHSRLKRNVMTASHTNYSLFLTFLTNSEELISAFLLQIFFCYRERPFFVCQRFLFIRLDAIVSIVVGCAICRASPFVVNDVYPWVFSVTIRTRGKIHARKCFYTFLNNSEQFFETKIDFF